MRVAFIVSDLTYPPLEGLHQQTLILLAGLAERGIDVDLHGYVKSLGSLDSAAMRRDLDIEFASPPEERPGSLLIAAARNALPGSASTRRIKRILDDGNYSVVHAEGISACCSLGRNDRGNAVLSFVDPGSRRNFRFFRLATTAGKRFAFLTAALVFFSLERWLRQGNPMWHVVSRADQQYLEKTHGYGRTVSIPVTLPDVLEEPEVQGNELVSEAASQRVRVLIYADLRLLHMRSALKEFVLQVCQNGASINDVEYVILGRVECDDEMAGWFQGLNYQFIAWADDYLGVVRSAHIVVLPDQVGTGLKNRAIQSMAAGVPVLGTTVAFEGIAVLDGTDAFVVTDIAGSGVRLGKLISDPDLRVRMGQSGRARVVSDFGTANVMARWIETYSQVSDEDGDPQVVGKSAGGSASLEVAAIRCPGASTEKS